MPGLLVIDKSCFQGVPESRLIEFVKNYNAVLPYVLYVECLVSDDVDNPGSPKDPTVLLNRMDKMVKAGAKVGCSSSILYQKEQETLLPVCTIIDTKTTNQIKDGVLKLDRDSIKIEAEYCTQTFEPKVRLLFDIGRKYYENVEKKGLVGNFRQEFEESDLLKRLGKWLQVLELKMATILETFAPDVAHKANNKWFTWHMVRLHWCWGMEWACRRSQSGSSLEDRNILEVSNDLYDIEYVTYLYQADGILTKDKKLVDPLARAAFPEKDVFSSLDEVPDSYRCDWS